MQELSITQARKQLPALLKAIQKNAEATFIIGVRNEPIAKLVSIRKKVKSGKAVKALLKMASSQKGKSRGKGRVTSENFKDYLYGPSLTSHD